MTATKHIGFRMAGRHLIPIFTARLSHVAQVPPPFAPFGGGTSPVRPDTP